VRLHLLSDPLNSLLMRLDQRATLGNEIVRHLVQRILILHARRDRLADKHALMELLAVPQHIGGERYSEHPLREANAVLDRLQREPKRQVGR